jgi:hypothetical protein
MNESMEPTRTCRDRRRSGGALQTALGTHPTAPASKVRPAAPTGRRPGPARRRFAAFAPQQKIAKNAHREPYVVKMACSSRTTPPPPARQHKWPTYSASVSTSSHQMDPAPAGGPRRPRDDELAYDRRAGHLLAREHQTELSTANLCDLRNLHPSPYSAASRQNQTRPAERSATYRPESTRSPSTKRGPETRPGSSSSRPATTTIRCTPVQDHSSAVEDGTDRAPHSTNLARGGRTRAQPDGAKAKLAGAHRPARGVLPCCGRRHIPAALPGLRPCRARHPARPGRWPSQPARLPTGPGIGATATRQTGRATLTCICRHPRSAP